MVRSIRAIDAAAASNTPAAVRTTASIRLAGASAVWSDCASDAPSRSRAPAPRASANAPIDATRRSGMISSPARSVSSSSSETSGNVSASLVSSAYTGASPVIRFQTVAARLNTSLRGDATPPANTSGAMNRGVPMPTVPASVESSWVATPKSTSVIPRSPQIRFAGFTSRWTICCSCTYWSASQVWRAYSITSGTGKPGVPRSSNILPRSEPFTSSMTM